MSETKKIYININKRFVRQDIPYVDAKTGESKTFNSVTIPNGTTLGDRDISGATFSPLFVNDNPRYKGIVTIPLLPDSYVLLDVPVRGEDGMVIVDEQGHWVTERVQVSPEELQRAVRDQYAAFREARNDIPSVWIGLNEKFVNERTAIDKETGEERTFSSVIIPHGVVVEGRDLGGASFTAPYVYRDEKRPSRVSIPFREDKPVSIQIPMRNQDGSIAKGEDGRWKVERVQIDPAVLKEAIAQEEKDFRASKAKEHEAERAAEPTALDEAISDAMMVDSPTAGGDAVINQSI